MSSPQAQPGESVPKPIVIAKAAIGRGLPDAGADPPAEDFGPFEPGNLVGMVFLVWANRMVEGVELVSQLNQGSHESYAQVLRYSLVVAYLPFREELKADGVQDIQTLYFGCFLPFLPEFDGMLNQLMTQDDDRNTGKGPAGYLQTMEAALLKQKGHVDHSELQEQWESVLEASKELIPASKQWDDRVRGLVGRLRRLGRMPDDGSTGRDPGDLAARLLWDIVYEDIITKTGPAVLMRTKEPRTIEDVLDIGHLTHRLTGEFRDDATIRGRTDTGQDGEVKIVRVKRVLGEQDEEVGLEYVNAESDTSDIANVLDYGAVRAYIERAYTPEAVQILTLWCEAQTQQDIAKALGIDQSSVSRTITTKLKDLKGKFGKE